MYILLTPQELQHLLKKGYVVTLRKDRKRPGYTQVKLQRGDKPYCIGFVTLIGYLKRDKNSGEIYVQHNSTVTPLTMYLQHTPYKDINEWINAFQKKRNVRQVQNVGLYSIELIKTLPASTYNPIEDNEMECLPCEQYSPQSTPKKRPKLHSIPIRH